MIARAGAGAAVEATVSTERESVRTQVQPRGAMVATAGSANGVVEPSELELRLNAVPLREEVQLVRMDLPPVQLEPLLERGILPGCRLCRARLSPGGDPILLVDGTAIALRREVANCLWVRCVAEPAS
jgi:Fe2+ transport system protein FeoA